MNFTNFNKLIKKTPQQTNNSKPVQPQLSSSKEVNIPKKTIKPSLVQMAKNVSKELIQNSKQFIKKGTIKSPPEESSNRFKICLGCEYYIQAKDRCSKCGCKMKIKTSLIVSKCPIGKW